MRFIVIQGGGDIASGVAYRLSKCGFPTVITELQAPLAVRRKVSFAQAMYDGYVMIEGVVGKQIENFLTAEIITETFSEGFIPVLNDPDGKVINLINPLVLIDARMRKRYSDIFPSARLVIGLGPGFIVGKNCHVSIETNRGHLLGRVIRKGSAEQDTGIPDQVLGFQEERVLRSPVDGNLVPFAGLGDRLEKNQLIAEVSSVPILAPFSGVLRGLIHQKVRIRKGMKIGDIDPRNEPLLCCLISDKALAIGGGVLEAILSFQDIRTEFFEYTQ
jgi:xanthine dehydrogenase accessory factor